MHPIVLIAFAAVLVGCGGGAREQVRQASASDPERLVLGPAFNDYVRRAILADGTETGIITCRDGSSARYWFRSHHRTRDEGGTLFRFSDGAEAFMVGYFCCELQLPEQQMASLSELRGFIHTHDGIRP